jgi:4-hydroxy-3-polyprenylbenzoate decarboxylase
MIVAPCSIRTLSAIAYGDTHNLLTRAADVHLKERRPLVLMVRESPLHLGHIRTMAQATEAGAIVAPPVPPFYMKPDSAEHWIDQIVRRALALLSLEDETLAPAQWRADRGLDGRIASAGRLDPS